MWGQRIVYAAGTVAAACLVLAAFATWRPFIGYLVDLAWPFSAAPVPVLLWIGAGALLLTLSLRLIFAISRRNTTAAAKP